MAGDGEEVVRFYTRTRRFPQLVGKTPDGAKIWGGPYSITGFVAAALVLYVGAQTIHWWGKGHWIINLAALAAAVYGVATGLTRLPLSCRYPMQAASGLLRCMTGPARGRLAGRALKLPRPHRARWSCTILPTTPASTRREPQPSHAATPTPIENNHAAAHVTTAGVHAALAAPTRS